MICPLNFVLQNRYKLSDTANKDHAQAVFHFNARKVFSDALSYARIQLFDQHLKKNVLGQTIDKKRGGLCVYLTEEEYRAVMYLA